MNIASCVICSDLFNDLNSISAAPCGHVYHTNCLKSWVATSKTCPECRSKTYLRTIKKLYFNHASKSDLSSLDLEGKVTYFTTQLDAKNEELETFEKERDEIIALMRGANKKFSNMKDSIFKLVKEVKELRVKAKDVPKLEAKVAMLEKENANLCNDSPIYEVCDRTTKRLQDGKDTLKDYGDYFKTCFNQELPKAVKSKDKVQDLNYKPKRVNRAYAVENHCEDARELRNIVLTKSTRSVERFFPSVDFDEKNPFASTDTKSKSNFSEMDKMLRREKLYGDAMKLRKRVFIESTSSLEMSPLVDFNEENPCASTTTKSKFSVEMKKMLKKEKLNEDAMIFRNRQFTSRSVSSIEILSPLENFYEKNVFASTTTKSKFSKEMLEREKPYEKAVEFRNRLLTPGSVSSIEILSPLDNFGEKNVFASTTTKSKFSKEMLEHEKPYEEAMKFRNRLFTESTHAIEILSRMKDFDEKNVFASTRTIRNMSKEIEKVLERENYTHIAEKRRKDIISKRKAKLQSASNALRKKTNMPKKASAPASNS